MVAAIGCGFGRQGGREDKPEGINCRREEELGFPPPPLPLLTLLLLLLLPRLAWVYSLLELCSVDKAEGEARELGR